jgi:uncharacterized protein (DUF4415 family)
MGIVGSYRHVRHDNMSNNSITNVTLEEILKKRSDGQKTNSDWARVDAMSDEDIDGSIRNDADWAEFIDIDWSTAEMITPAAKKSISIRMDEDVIDFFKSTGKGYQTRINAVLRHYMREHANKKG